MTDQITLASLNGFFIFILLITIFTIFIGYLFDKKSGRDNKKDNGWEYKTENGKDIRETENFVYITNFANKFGENNYSTEDLVRLQKLLQQKGNYIEFNTLKSLVSKEYENIEYKDFRARMLHNNPGNIESLIDSYVDSFPSESGRNFNFMFKLCQELGFLNDYDLLAEKIEKRKELITISNFEHFLLSDTSFITFEEIDLMDGQEFEVFLERLFRKIGYSVTRTPYVRDQGADLIVEKLGERMVVQAKRSNQQVSNKAIQEAVAALKHYSASKAIVVTNNYFTKGAIDLARSNNVILIDKDKLNKLMNRSSAY